MPLLLVFSFAPALASISPPNWDQIKGSAPKERILSADTLLKRKIKALPKIITEDQEINEAQLLYFLEAHLDTLKTIGLNCKHEALALTDAIERSVMRESDPLGLEGSYRDELKILFSAICKKH